MTFGANLAASEGLRRLLQKVPGGARGQGWFGELQIAGSWNSGSAVQGELEIRDSYTKMGDAVMDMRDHTERRRPMGKEDIVASLDLRFWKRKRSQEKTKG